MIKAIINVLILNRIQKQIRKEKTFNLRVYLRLNALSFCFHKNVKVYYISVKLNR